MRTFLIASLHLILIAKAAAQATNSLSFQLTIPAGDYKNTYPKTGTGLLFSTLHLVKNSPFFSVGGEAGIIQVSSSDKRYEGLYHNKYDVYNISASNYIFTISAKLRVNLHTFNNSIKIFADFGLGINLFLSYAAISNTNTASNEVVTALFGGTQLYDIVTGNNSLQIDSSSLHNSWALRTGMGLGTEIPFGKRKQLAILFKCSYLYGSRVKYFSHPTIDGVTINMEPKESNTSMLLAETGIRFKIHSKK